MTARRARSTAERVVFAAVVAVLASIAGAIATLGVTPRDPARVTVQQVGEARVVDGDTYLTAEVRNRGDETAEAVQVVAEVMADGQVVTTGEQLVDYLSGGETEQVVFIFGPGLPSGEPRLRVASYLEP